MRRMKVLFLVADELMPSSRVRVVNLLPELNQAGITATIFPYPRSLKGKLKLPRLCRRHDVTFLQKKMPSPLEALLLRRFSHRLVFDFDDAIIYRHDAREELESWSRQLKFDWLLRQTDLVVAGNPILASHAARKARRIVVVPSAVETRNIPSQLHTHQASSVVIGWVGTSGNLHHLLNLAQVIQKLASHCPIVLRVVSDKPIALSGVQVEHVVWRLETQEQEIARFDIGIMPLPQTRFAEGKCGYKALQYMAAAVPPVVSDVGVNGQIVEHGRSGWVAKTSDDFYDGLLNLVNSPALRLELGRNARERVEAHYSIPVIGRQLATELLRVAQG